MGIDIGRNKRAVLKKMLDKFTTFSWDGLDSFENFGAFITNNKEIIIILLINIYISYN